MTISLEEEQHGEDEMQDVDANVNTLDEEVLGCSCQTAEISAS